MSPGKDYAPCPHCAANNVTYRQVCWRCGYALPYTVGLDGKPRFNVEAQMHAAERAEINRLLQEAQTIDITEVKKRQAEQTSAASGTVPEGILGPDTPLKVRAWLWLQRRLERPSGM